MTLKSIHTISRSILILGLATLSTLPATTALAGSLVLVGGNWAFPGQGGIEEEYGISIYDKIVDLAGGTSAARIGIISTASGNPARSAGFYLDDFAALYGDAVDGAICPHHP